MFYPFRLQQLTSFTGEESELLTFPLPASLPIDIVVCIIEKYAISIWFSSVVNSCCVLPCILFMTCDSVGDTEIHKYMF